jgi:hypothetical protein
MPLQALKFKPGVSRDNTSLANEGGWFECDKVRFRAGYPEKIGGWVLDTGTAPANEVQPPAGAFWGVCRSLWNWVSLAGRNYLSLGTHLKLYIQDSADAPTHDITPIRTTSTIASNAFTTTDTSTTVVVNEAAHGATNGDFVIISGVSGAVNGIPDTDLNKEFRLTYIDSSTYSIVVATAATSSGTTGACTVEYEINAGSATYTTAAGWGAGGWGGATVGFASTGWGASAATGVGVDLRLWSQINYGEYLIANPRGGAIYLWVPATSPSTFYRAQELSASNTNTQDGVAYWTTDSSCPSACNIVHVSDSSRFVIAFGCNDYGETEINPLLVRWSDQEDYSTWAPAITNQAGSFTLSSGSQIVAIKPQRQEILVFTDAALYSMQYLGPPYVWGFQQMGTNISVVSQNAVATAANVTFWMGVDKFYMYDGRVQTLPCSLRQHVFNNINIEQAEQTIAGTNEGFNEVWWFYCSGTSTTVNSYVVFNYAEKVWYYGTLARTAWLDSPIRYYPMGASYNGQFFYHENGVDDGSTNPPSAIESYIQSSDFDIGDGHNYGFVWRLIPDVNFDGSTGAAPQVTFTARPRQNPGAAYGASATPTVTSGNNYTGQREYIVQQFTEIVYVRIRGRQMAFKISSSDVGTAWQLGAPRIDLRPDGRR